MRPVVTPTLAVAVLLGVALLVRLAAALWWQERIVPPERFGFPDSESYWVLGQTLAQGEPYRFGEYAVFRAPGYPALLAPLFLVAGDGVDVIWARVLGAGLGTLTVGCVMWLTLQMFDRPTALAAGLCAAFYPGAIVMSVLILSEAAFCPLMIVQIIVWMRAWQCANQRNQHVYAALAGVAGGLATLVRPGWLLFTPFAIVAAVALDRHRWRHVALAPALLLSLCATMAPWWIRNYHVTGRFVPTTLQVGASLYDGLNPQATGASDMRFVDEHRTQLLKSDAHLAKDATDTFEYRLDRRLRHRALSWLWANPRQAWRLSGVKLVRLWNIWPNEGSLRSWPVRIIVAAGYLPIMICAVGGAIRFWSRGWPYVLCVLPALYFTVLHSIFVSSIRYRQPAVLVLMSLAAGCLVAVWRQTRSA